MIFGLAPENVIMAKSNVSSPPFSSQPQGNAGVQKNHHILMRSGPLPDPSELAEYEKIKTGFAERILIMAEKQSSHRQELEQTKLAAEVKQFERRDDEAKRGQLFALIIVLATIGGGIYTALRGAQIFGSIIGGLGIASIIYIFVNGRRKH